LFQREDFSVIAIIVNVKAFPDEPLPLHQYCAHHWIRMCERNSLAR
jgi:hypothetical protein